MGRTVRDSNIDRLIGQRVRARRALLDLSQSDLADKLGVSPQQVQKYEKGTNRLAGSRLVKTSEILQCAVSDLTGDGNAGPQARRADELMMLFRTPGAPRLLRSFAGIQNPSMRSSIVLLVENINRNGGVR